MSSIFWEIGFRILIKVGCGDKFGETGVTHSSESKQYKKFTKTMNFSVFKILYSWLHAMSIAIAYNQEKSLKLVLKIIWSMIINPKKKYQ